MLVSSLDGVGQWLVHTLGWLSLELVVFAGLVYAVTRWGGVRSSRVRRWLWTLVLVKPLVALLIAWPVALPTREAGAIAQMAAANDATLVLPAASSEALIGAYEAPSDTGTVPHTVVRDVAPKLTGFAVLAALWLAGVGCMAAYSLMGAVWLTQARLLALPLTWDDIAETCDTHRASVRALLARTELRMTTKLNEPCLFGFLRPTILLPTWCLEDDAPPNLAYILLHEGAHRRARDHWFLWFRRAVETALWFHPAVWYAGQKAMEEAENTCDEAVVALAEAEGTPSAAVLYSSCLMRVLERATRHPFEGFVPGVIPTAERIRRLVQRHPGFGVGPRRAAVVGVALFAAAALPGSLVANASLGNRALSARLRDRPTTTRDVVYSSKMPGDYFFNLYLVRADGSGLMRLTDDQAEYSQPRWAPDASRIAAHARTADGQGYGVYVLGADGSKPTRVSVTRQDMYVPEQSDYAADWSPDGKRLVCQTASRAVGADAIHNNVYILAVDGSAQRRLTDDAADYARPAWSPAGKDIALLRRERGGLRWDLALIATDGSNMRILSDVSSLGVHRSSPAWSKDGRKLAYLAFTGGPADPCELRVLDVETLESSVVGLTGIGFEDNVGHLAWSPDDDYLVIADRRRGDTRRRLYRVSLADGAVLALTPLNGHAKQPDVGPPARARPAGRVPPITPGVFGPVTDPETLHVYYAVVRNSRVTWDEANAEALRLRHEGKAGSLAAVSSAAESSFLLTSFPYTHHGFWLGGLGLAERAEAAGLGWSWVNGEPWRYTPWFRGEEPTPSEMAPRVGTLTWSYDPARPARAGSLTAHEWTGRGASSDEFGYIVEFGSPQLAGSGE